MRLFPKIFIAVLFFVIIALLFLNTNNIVPSNEADPLLASHKYKEGFASEYASYPNNASLDSGNEWDISPSAKNCYRIFGENGLACSPNSTDVNPTDIYSRSSGSLTCESYGLSNSRGFLCLDENQRKLYTTRGGNAV